MRLSERKEVSKQANGTRHLKFSEGSRGVVVAVARNVGLEEARLKAQQLLRLVGAVPGNRSVQLVPPSEYLHQGVVVLARSAASRAWSERHEHRAVLFVMPDERPVQRLAVLAFRHRREGLG